MKFSIIVPVYNVEKYVLKCLESINNQTYQNYEVIIVNDGATDNSEDIIKKYIKGKKQFKYYKKKNGGLSDARNYGLKYITGDYLIFIDSDDTVNKNLLEKLNDELIQNNVDLVKYNVQLLSDAEKKIFRKTNFINKDVHESLSILLKDELFEPAWQYCYKVTFWQKHNFLYTKGRIHEDFGLTPLIIMNASKISSIDYIGYNYLVRDNSIMTSTDKEKLMKKFVDCFNFYKENIPLINKNKNINDYDKKLLKSYYANGIISKLMDFSQDEIKKMLPKLKEEKVFDNLMDDTFKRKLKKFLYQNFPLIFIRGKNK